MDFKLTTVVLSTLPKHERTADRQEENAYNHTSYKKPKSRIYKKFNSIIKATNYLKMNSASE